MKHRLLAAALSLCISMPVLAQVAPGSAVVSGKVTLGAATGQVSVTLTQRKVLTDAKGAKQLVDAQTVRPNEVIEYRATYTNRGDRAVKGLIASLPIPEGLEYMSKSAKPLANVQVSAKDGRFANEPLLRKGPDGKDEPVPYDEYRTLRWKLGQLGPHASVVVSARARVEATVPETPAAGGASVPQATSATKP